MDRGDRGQDLSWAMVRRSCTGRPVLHLLKPVPERLSKTYTSLTFNLSKPNKRLFCKKKVDLQTTGKAG